MRQRAGEPPATQEPRPGDKRPFATMLSAGCFSTPHSEETISLLSFVTLLQGTSMTADIGPKWQQHDRKKSAALQKGEKRSSGRAGDHFCRAKLLKGRNLTVYFDSALA